MNQNYQADPLLNNYLAPSYPIFIQIKFLISGLSAKKAVKNAKSDITDVKKSSFSLLRNWDQKASALSFHLFWKLLKFANLKTNLKPVPELLFCLIF